MRNGGEYEARVDMPKGHGVLTPLTPAEKRAKFFDNVNFSNTVPADRAENALGLLERLEEVDDVTEVFKLLVV
jgi:transcriptional/translational regulatory protein YebC/TACO1